VTSNFAALDDVILFGDKLDMGKFEPEDIERYKQALIHRLKNPPSEEERQEMMEQARQTFTWEKTATNWDREMS
jgi:glycosyltransferase involved in cell wall biosynthesis